MLDIRQQIADLSPERRRLLEALLQQDAATAPAASLHIPQQANATTAPLSFAQQRMWVLTQFEPDNPLYTMPIAMRLTGALDVDALEASLDALVRRHAILRTTFTTGEDGQPCQAIAPTLHLPLPLHRPLRNESPHPEDRPAANCSGVGRAPAANSVATAPRGSGRTCHL